MFARISFILLATAVSVIAAESKKPADSGMDVLVQTSLAFTQIAKKATPATVYIKATIVPVQQNVPNPFEGFNDEFFRRFFGQNPFGQQVPQQQLSAGSGFLIRPDGYIVTNFHVVKDATSITATLNDGREYPATLKGSDPRTDLAVLKIDDKNLPFLTFGDSDDLQIGEWVVAIGNPFGLEASLSSGIVSAKGRQDLGIATFEDFIQTDAAINPGNSGGALLNLQGDVIGVNTAIASQSGGYQGIGFSIPSKMAANVVDQIIGGGAVKRAHLGVILQPIDKDLTDAIGLDRQEGILISEIVKDSPAQKAGLLQGDVIISYNDKPVKSANKFRNEIAMMNPGAELKLRILRNNKPMTIAVSLGTQSEGEVATAELSAKLGLELENLTSELAAKLNVPSELEGAVISKVKPNSAAALAGLRPGFLITGVAINWNNQKKIKNLAEFDEAIKELGDKKHLILIVRHQNFQRYYTIKIN
jgi:serine protease Do